MKRIESNTPKAGHPKKGELEPRSGTPMFFPLVRIDPTKRAELLADPLRRSWVADRIEEVLGAEDFATWWRSPAGGLDAELERIGRWLEWHTESPAYLLAEAWESENSKRAALVSRWMLIKGKPARRELRALVKKLPLELVDETDNGPFFIPNPETKFKTIYDAAFTLALMVCNPPEGDGSLSRNLAQLLVETEPKNRRTERRLNDLEKAVRANLKKLGFVSH